MLVAADIVKTIAIELTFVSLGLLAGLVVVRTFLSWTLTLEIEAAGPGSRSVRRRTEADSTLPVRCLLVWIGAPFDPVPAPNIDPA